MYACEQIVWFSCVIFRNKSSGHEACSILLTTKSSDISTLLCRDDPTRFVGRLVVLHYLF